MHTDMQLIFLWVVITLDYNNDGDVKTCNQDNLVFAMISYNNVCGITLYILNVYSDNDDYDWVCLYVTECIIVSKYFRFLGSLFW